MCRHRLIPRAVVHSIRAAPLRKTGAKSKFRHYARSPANIGPRVTWQNKLLLAGLSCSYIVSSGVVKDLARAMMNGEVAQWWHSVPLLGPPLAGLLGKLVVPREDGDSMVADVMLGVTGAILGGYMDGVTIDGLNGHAVRRGTGLSAEERAVVRLLEQRSASS